MMMDVEPPEPHKSGHRWVDMIVAFTALLVSIISLVLAMVHGRTMEKMADANARLVQANSWPFLQTSTSNQDDRGASVITLNVANSGVGPAKVHSAELFYRGRPLRSWGDLLDHCCRRPGEKTRFAFSGAAMHGVLRAGDSTPLLTLVRSKDNAAVWDALNRERLGVGYRLCYCSVFDECWITDGETLTPTPIRTCPVPAVTFRPAG